MRSNTGVIGAERLTAPSGATGVHGLADHYDNVKAGTWPAGTAWATVVPSVAACNEGDTVVFTVNAYSPTGQTTLWWAMIITVQGVMTPGDFTSSTYAGSVAMTPGPYGSLTGTVSRTWTNDVLTEGTEVFAMTISLTNGGPVIATSTNVAVVDTSVSAHALGAFTDTLSSDPGDGAFTALYSGAVVDEGSVQVDTGITFLVQGASMTRIGINSNSYVVFGTAATTFSYPSYFWNDTQPAFPSVGCCAGNDSANDGNYQYVGYRTVSGGFQIRFKGAVNYSVQTVNRIWDLTVFSGSNQIKVEYRALSTTAAWTWGALIAFKSATAVTYQSTTISAGQAWSFWT